jgi:hypothetical protein
MGPSLYVRLPRLTVFFFVEVLDQIHPAFRQRLLGEIFIDNAPRPADPTQERRRLPQHGLSPLRVSRQPNSGRTAPFRAKPEQ